MSFIELPNGRLINKDAIRDFNPATANRLNYIGGTHELIPEEYAPAILEALKPKEESTETTEQPKQRKTRKAKEKTTT